MNFILLCAFLLIFDNQYLVSTLGLCSEGDSSQSVDIPQPKLVRIPRDDQQSKTESRLWGNPCNYPHGKKPKENWNEQDRKLADYAKDVELAALSAIEDLKSYRNSFVNTMYGVEEFDTFIETYKDKKWLRSMSWFTDDLLPEENGVFKPVSDSYLKGLMAELNEVLPNLHKANKMVLSGLRELAFNGVCRDKVKKNKELRPNLDESTRKVRTTLCKFSVRFVGQVTENPLSTRELVNAAGVNEAMGFIMTFVKLKSGMCTVPLYDEYFPIAYYVPATHSTNGMARSEEFMDKRGVEPELMDKSEKAKLIDNNTAALIYRDAMDYLQYIEQVFKSVQTIPDY